MKRKSSLIAVVLLFLIAGFVLGNADESKSVSIADKSTSVSIDEPRYVSKVKRIWGEDRYQTAKAIAQEFDSGLVEHIVLAPGDDFRYAIPASVLAYQKQAPLLIVGKGAPTKMEAFEYIEKHLSENGVIYAVGDAEFFTSELENLLSESGHIKKVIRLCGEDKFETNSLIAKELNLQSGGPVVIATGEDYPDALSISSFAAMNEWPILFTEANGIPRPVKEYLETIQPSQIYIPGGKGAVSDLVEEELALINPSSEIIRFSGKDRYETSLLIAKRFAPNPQNIFVSSGKSFPDAAAGGVLAAKTADPILLVDPKNQKELPIELKQYIKERSLETNVNIVCLGGYGAVPAQTERLLKNEIMIVNPYVKYSYEQMLTDIERLTSSYPEIIERETIGQSVEDRELILLKLGKGNRQVFLNGSFHAREYITTTFLMKMIDEYAYAYTNDEMFDDYDVRNLLNQITLYIVPMVNPDGVNLVQNGIGAVKDPQKVKRMRIVQPHLGHASWKANINGVDLNRNFPVGWEQKSTNTYVPSSENYKGVEPATEPEVKAIMDLVINHDFKIIASYHTQGEDIFWSDKNCSSFNHILEPMANRLVKLTGYKKGPKVHSPGDWGAGIADWTRLQTIPTFTVELCPYRNDLPYPDSEFDDVWERVNKTGLFFAQEAVNL